MILRLLLLFVLAIGALYGGVWTYRSLYPSAISLPEPVLVDLQGQMHALKEWRGKLLVVNFWATWCAPCREEIPVFVSVQDEFKDKSPIFGLEWPSSDLRPLKRFISCDFVDIPSLFGQNVVDLGDLGASIRT